MSAPADNTRLKHASGKSGNAVLSKKSKVNKSVSLVLSSKERKRSELVNKWLIKVQKGKVDSREWSELEQLCFQEPDDHRSPKEKSVNANSDTLNKSFHPSKEILGSENYLSGDLREDDGIALGASAVSTESINMRRSQHSKIAEIVNKEKGEIGASSSYQSTYDSTHRSKHKIHHDHTKRAKHQRQNKSRHENSQRQSEENWSSVQSEQGTGSIEWAKRAGEHIEYEHVHVHDHVEGSQSSQTSNIASEVGDSSESENSKETEQEKRKAVDNPFLNKDELVEIEKLRQGAERNDPAVFYNMFELLITKLTSIHDSVMEIKKEQSQVSDRLLVIETSMEYMGSTVDEMDEDLAEIGEINIKLVQAAVKCEDEIKSVKSKIKKVVGNQNRSSLIISGLAMGEKASSVKQLVIDFFEKEMKIEAKIDISTAFVLRNKKDVWVQLVKVSDIDVIFAHVSNLKGKKNRLGKYYRIERVRTEEEREARNRQQQLLTENRRMPISHQIRMQRKGGDLMINGDKYRKQVVPPKNRSMLLMSKDEQRITEAVKISKGTVENEKGSSFIAFASKVNSWEDIRKAYQKVKMENMSATHVMCGYRIFGANFPTLQDYSSDGEYFGGKEILKVLKEAKGLEHCCICGTFPKWS